MLGAFFRGAVRGLQTVAGGGGAQQATTAAAVLGSSGAAAAAARGARQQLTGFVVSDKMDRSVVVAVHRRVMVQKYKRMVSKTSRIMAHDPEGVARLGDKVIIEPSRPISKRKHHVVVEVVRKSLSLA